MKDDRKMEWLLECLIHIIGRAAVKVEEVRQIVETGRKVKTLGSGNPNIVLMT